jgi:hypothetical protein
MREAIAKLTRLFGYESARATHVAGTSAPSDSGVGRRRPCAVFSRAEHLYADRRPSRSLAAAVGSAVLINPSRESGAWLETGLSNLDVEAERVLVEIPTGFTEMLAQRPELALEWRLATRDIFQTYFRRGYRVVDFLLAREAGLGQYLLARPVEGQG